MTALDSTILVPLRDSQPLISAGALDWLAGCPEPLVFVVPAEDDGSRGAVESWLEKHEPSGGAKVIVQSRPRLYGALNDGLEAVGTRYVQQCGIDDQVYWRRHGEVRATIGDRRPLWIVGRCDTRGPGGRRTAAGTYRNLLHRWTAGLVAFSNVVGSPAVIFDAARVRALGGWVESMPAAADYDLWLRLRREERPFLLPFATGCFVVKPESSLTKAHRSQSLQDCYEIRRRYYGRRLAPELARGLQALQFNIQDLLGE